MRCTPVGNGLCISMGYKRRHGADTMLEVSFAESGLRRFHSEKFYQLFLNRRIVPRKWCHLNIACDPSCGKVPHLARFRIGD